MAKWIINGVPAETIWRVKTINGNYEVSFRKEDATLADIEGIDWAHPVVERAEGNNEQFHCLPEGYGFKLDRVDYIGSLKKYTASISVLTQYLGDVTGYQAQIDEQNTTIRGLREDLNTANATMTELSAQLAEADELAISLYEELETTALVEAEQIAGEEEQA